MCTCTNSLQYLLHHDASTSNRRSWWGQWHLYPVPNWWQLIQPEAPSGSQKDNEASIPGNAVCWWCCPCCSFRRHHAAHHILLCRGNTALYTCCQPKEDRKKYFTNRHLVKSITLSPHLHREDRAQIGPSVHISGMYHFLWCEVGWEIDSRLAKSNSAFVGGSTSGCGTANTWRKTPKLMYTEQLYWPHFFTAPRHGLRTNTIFVYLRGSISAVFVHSLASTRVSPLQMLKSLRRQVFPAWKPCSWSHSYDGQDMCNCA